MRKLSQGKVRASLESHSRTRAWSTQPLAQAARPPLGVHSQSSRRCGGLGVSTRSSEGFAEADPGPESRGSGEPHPGFAPSGLMGWMPRVSEALQHRHLISAPLCLRVESRNPHAPEGLLLNLVKPPSAI